jgi:RES domain-containing protein
LNVYRITRRLFASDLSGSGGLRASGRCHRKGTPVIYAAQHVSLALAEVLVHLEISELPLDYVLVTIEIPDDVPMRRATSHQALSASANPDVPFFLVPSVVVPQELNVVMFPQAAGFEARIVSIESFRIDSRLLGQGENR